MKRPSRLPNAADYGIDTRSVECPFCASDDRVELESMTGGAANELLMRCTACRSFFYVLKDPVFLSSLAS